VLYFTMKDQKEIRMVEVNIVALNQVVKVPYKITLSEKNLPELKKHMSEADYRAVEAFLKPPSKDNLKKKITKNE